MIYRSFIEFTDGRTHDDIWKDEESMMVYVERAPYFDKIKRAEAYIMDCKEGDILYDIDKYLFEYDIDGHYYHTKCIEK